MKSYKLSMIFGTALVLLAGTTWAAPPSGTPAGSNRRVTPQRGTGRISKTGAQRRAANNSRHRSAGRGLRTANQHTDRPQPPERPGDSDKTRGNENRSTRNLPSPNLGNRDTAHRIALRNRLASIAMLRDRAIETGNTRLLEQADRLEQQARNWFERQQNQFVTPLPTEPADSTPTAPETGTVDVPDTATS